MLISPRLAVAIFFHLPNVNRAKYTASTQASSHNRQIRKRSSSFWISISRTRRQLHLHELLSYIESNHESISTSTYKKMAISRPHPMDIPMKVDGRPWLSWLSSILLHLLVLRVKTSTTVLNTETFIVRILTSFKSSSSSES